MEGAAARAMASLPGRTGVSATSQEGKQLLCDPFQLDGLLLRAYCRGCRWAASSS